jgi:hypothetical protein
MTFVVKIGSRRTKMKKKYLTILSILIITILSACGPAPTPTLSVADVQGTAVADAWIALTQTQAAAPTATQTPIPPTPTATLAPLPTATLLLLPTLELLPVATLPDTSATDPCNQPPPIKPQGVMVKIKLVNKSGGNVSPLSLGMMQENSFKECGTYNFSLGQFDEQVVDVLAGCYWGFGYLNGAKPSTPQTAEILCVTDATKVTTIWVTKDVIGFH